MSYDNMPLRYAVITRIVQFPYMEIKRFYGPYVDLDKASLDETLADAVCCLERQHKSSLATLVSDTFSILCVKLWDGLGYAVPVDVNAHTFEALVNLLPRDREGKSWCTRAEC
jgi:hypothetical protein